MSNSYTRRHFLQAGAAGIAAGTLVETAHAGPVQPPNPKDPPTRFQIACMTLPYGAFPLQRALAGIHDAGYRHVALYLTHTENGKRISVLPAGALPERARELATRCRDLGLEPVLMFSGVYPEAKNGLEVLQQRIRQAGAARIAQVLTFGHTRGGNEKLWLERFRRLAPLCRDQDVTLVVKQHGGETGTGAACAKITREVNDPRIKVNYDAGNVMDYLEGKVNPLTDLAACASEVRSFCIKDHRFFPPPHQDCGPGLGEIDHYRLLYQVAFTGRTIPLCCENIFAPRVPRPTQPAGIDALARRAREFLELVVAGIQAAPK